MIDAALGTSLVAYLGLVVAAWVWRSRPFAIFVLVALGLPTLVGFALRPHLILLGPLVWPVHLAACIHFAALLFRPAMRPPWFRLGISIPGLWFIAATLLALPWAIVAALGLPPLGAEIPFVLAALGVVQTSWTRPTTVDVLLDGRDVPGLARHPEGLIPAAQAPADRPLRVVQITDPHLGPFMSVARLRRICERAVARDPDLVLITGDLMTMESQRDDVVTAALEPLAALRGRVFACHGNHDLEARAVVARAYRRLGLRLLIDALETVETPVGPVEILGLDFVWRGRQAHLQEVCAAWPRRSDALRLALLHDPGAFRHLPPGATDLVFSGHTHGGQVGLVSLGLPVTLLSLVSSIPDHGLWARGTDRLYVHRANGVYGFPIRLGVPAEESLIRIHRRVT